MTVLRAKTKIKINFLLTLKLFLIESIMKPLVGDNPWYIRKETASAMSFTNSICFFLWLWRNDAKRTRIFGLYNFLIFSLKNGNCNLSPSLQNERAHSPESNDNQIMVLLFTMSFCVYRYAFLRLWRNDVTEWRFLNIVKTKVKSII